MEKFPLPQGVVQCAVVEIEEVRCDMNADFSREKMADSERSMKALGSSVEH